MSDDIQPYGASLFDLTSTNGQDAIDQNNALTSKEDSEYSDNEYGEYADEAECEVEEEGDEISDTLDESGIDDGHSPRLSNEESATGLSAYEMLRLERIRRNQEYLAGLGLDKSLKSDTKQKKSDKKTDVVEKRESIFRRSKAKEVNYSEKPEKKAEKTETTKPREELKTKNSAGKSKVARFIYRELKVIEANRKQAIKASRKMLQTAELELSYAKRQVSMLQRQKQMKEEAEERQRLLPLLQQLDRRRDALIRARDTMQMELTTKADIARATRKQFMQNVKKAQNLCPKVFRQAKLHLSHLLFERSPGPETEDTACMNGSGDAKISETPIQHKHVPTVKSQSVFEENRKDLFAVLEQTCMSPMRKKKERHPLDRNVGGPVTAEFADKLQRRWLENDSPLAANLGQYIPQVGDIALYYPAAHYKFVREHPDTTVKRRRLYSRKPLWEKTRDYAENVVNNDFGSDKIQTNSKSWFSNNWPSSITQVQGSYPIVCRVERTLAEFPSDQASSDPSKKVNDNVHEGQKFIDVSDSSKTSLVSNNTAMHLLGRRRQSKENGPFVGLLVTLKPLSPVLPPTLKNGDLTDEETLSLAPVFSVLMFPSSTPFLIPFSWAYRCSMSFHIGDRVESISGKGPRLIGTVIHPFEHLGSERDVFSLVGAILRTDIKGDFSTSQILDDLIAEIYSERNISSAPPVPEVDFRYAVQVLTYQYHKAIALGNLPSFTESGDLDNVIESTIIQIWKLIRFTLPRLGGAIIRWDGMNTDVPVSTWEIRHIVTRDKHECDALAKALSPTIVLTSASSCFGGYTYHLDTKLRAEVESTIISFLESIPETRPFLDPVEDTFAPGYTRYVPIGMCFRRIQKRLKLQPMRYLQQNLLLLEDITIQDDGNESQCSYYRSLGALLADIKEVYFSCLLYNTPHSEIVAAALSVTDRLISVIKDLETKHIRSSKKKDIFKPSSDATSFIPSAVFSLERFNVAFDVRLHYDWVEKVDPDGSFYQVSKSKDSIDHGSAVAKEATKFWLPQCGDKVFYNLQMHGRFVSGHSNSLTTEQKILPHVQPASKLKGKKDSSNILDLFQYWMLGTVSWVKIVFPQPPTNESDDGIRFDVLSPILALGIRFNYNWLSKDDIVVFWRPCCVLESNHNTTFAVPFTQSDKQSYDLSADSILQNDHTSDQRFCKYCGLSSSFSYLIPAWKGQSLRILPPFPLNALKDLKPAGISEADRKSLVECFEVLRTRSSSGLRFDYIESSSITEVLPLDDLSSYLNHFFSDSEDDMPDNRNSNFTFENLCQANFLPYWSARSQMIPGSKRVKKKLETEEDTSWQSSYKSLLASPGLCLDLIHKRLQSGYYRSRLAIAHDIRESFVSCALFIIKENSGSRGLNSSSGKRMAKKLLFDISRDIKASGIEYQNIIDETKTGEKMLLKSLKISSNSHHNEDYNRGKTRTRLDVDETLRHIFSGLDLTALTCEAPDALNNRENAIIKKLFPLLDLHSAALLCVLDMAIGEAALGVKSNVDNVNADMTCVPMNRATAWKNVNAILATLSNDSNDSKHNNSSWPCIKIKVKLNDVDFFYEGASFINQMSCPSLHRTGETGESSEGFGSLVEPVAEQEEFEFVDLEKSIASFSYHEYLSNRNLTRALFCDQDKRDACVKCKLNHRSLLDCRVRNRHLNPDFTFMKYFEEIGGVDGLILLLVPSVRPSDHVTKLQHENSGSSDKGGPLLLNAEGGKSIEIPCPRAKLQSEVDPIELLKKAELAYALAQQEVAKSIDALNSEIELSEEFVTSNFAIDVLDGHYEVCIRCGHGGDVVCCESCPSVLHAACAGLNSIPEGDWYCKRCSLKRTQNEQKKMPNLDTSESVTPDLNQLLESLRSARMSDYAIRGVSDQQKSKPIDSSNQEKSSLLDPAQIMTAPAGHSCRDILATKESKEPVLMPGFVDATMTFYCCKENDSCVIIAKKIGCNNWYSIASLPDNQHRYGPQLYNEKTRLRKGSIIRIPTDHDKNLVKSLVLGETNKQTEIDVSMVHHVVSASPSRKRRYDLNEHIDRVCPKQISVSEALVDISSATT